MSLTNREIHFRLNFMFFIGMVLFLSLFFALAWEGVRIGILEDYIEEHIQCYNKVDIIKIDRGEVSSILYDHQSEEWLHLYKGYKALCDEDSLTCLVEMKKEVCEIR